MVVCEVCGRGAGLSCSICDKVWYCSREHQEADAEKHRKWCPKYKITILENKPHLFSTRDLPEGTVVLEEEPLVLSLTGNVPHCLGCYSLLLSTYKCSKCNWPLCQESCERSEKHKLECELFSSHKIGPFSVVSDLYVLIPLFRCLALKQQSPHSWTRFLKLGCSLQNKMFFPEFFIDARNIVPIVRNFFRAEEYPDKLLLSIWSTFLMNCFHPYMHEGTPRERSFVGLYPEGAMLVHSCIPSCYITFDENFKLIVRCAVDVPAQSVLSISFVHVLASTKVRHRKLRYLRALTCYCRRCLDPTELFSHVGSIKCPSCNEGYMTANTPIDLTSEWSCEQCSCTTGHQAADRVFNEVEQKFSSLRSHQTFNRVSQIMNRISEVSDFIRSMSRTVHPNYFRILDAKVYMIQLYWDMKHAKTMLDNEVEEAWKTCDEFLSVLTIISPGMSTDRAIIEYRQIVFERMQSDESIPKKKRLKNLPGSFHQAEELRSHIQRLKKCAFTLEYLSPTSFLGGMRMEIENEIRALLLELAS